MTKFSDMRSLADTLDQLFQKCFVNDLRAPHKPLTLGIDRELIALSILTATEARHVFPFYARRLMYQRALVAGGARFDLDGKPCGEVTAEQMAAAQLAVAAIEKKRAEKARAIAVEKRTARAAAKVASVPPWPVRRRVAPMPAKNVEPKPGRLSLANLKTAWLA